LRNGRACVLFAIGAAVFLAVPVIGLQIGVYGTDRDQLDAQDIEDDSEVYEIVEKEWAVYIYCGADNDFESVTDFALDQCVKALVDSESVTRSIHVVALLDRQSEPGTWVYELIVSGWDVFRPSAGRPTSGIRPTRTR